MSNQENIQLLNFVRHFFETLSQSIEKEENELFEVARLAESKNSWFTLESIKSAADGWVSSLSDEDISLWLGSVKPKRFEQTVGLILAGNIPFVGLHDLLSSLVSGYKVKVKLSSKDEVLMLELIKQIKSELPELESAIMLNTVLKEIDYLMATGTDNSARYFDAYFKDVPKIIRKNRTSVAVLDGHESEDMLKALSRDVFLYFGLGCRNVTKVYVPKGYDLDLLFNAFFPYQDIVNHNKYANNYDYNKAVYLLNKIELVENGFLLLKEDTGLHSPIGVLFYEEYDHLSKVESHLTEQADSIQCIVSNVMTNAIKFGNAQEPKLWDYADGINPFEFLNTKV